MPKREYFEREDEVLRKYDVQLNSRPGWPTLLYCLNDGYGSGTIQLARDPEAIRGDIGDHFLCGGATEEEAGIICLWVCRELGLEIPW